MTKSLFIAIVTIGISGSCKKNAVDPVYGSASATPSDGSSWVAEARAAFLRDSAGLLSFAFTDEKHRSIARKIFIADVPLEEGTFAIAPMALSHLSTDSVSAILIFYNLDVVFASHVALDSSWFSITNLDLVNNQVEGAFDIGFVKNPITGSDTSPFPDTIRFRDGEYSTKIVN